MNSVYYNNNMRWWLGGTYIVYCVSSEMQRKCCLRMTFDK